MLVAEILMESRLTFSRQDFDKALADSEYGVVYVYGDKNGNVHLGEYPDGREFYRSSMVIWPKDKRIEIRRSGYGNKVTPKAQQMLAALRDGGIIDNTWRIKSPLSDIGRYRTDTSKWITVPNPLSQQPLDYWTNKKNRLSRVSQDLVFYHGTSSRDWEKIKTKGLYPLFTGSNTQYGSESRGKHEGNVKVLYLASSINKAHDYAKLRVSWWNRRLKRPDRDYDDNSPMVLAVRIPDPLRLVSDDDVVSEIARDQARKLFNAKPKEEQERIMRELSQQRGFAVTDPSIGQMLWRETPEGFAEVMARVPQKAYKTWLASLRRNDQVGYRGIIPPKFITPIELDPPTD